MAVGPTLKMKKRLKYVVLVAFVLAFAVVVGNLVRISVVQYDFYTEKANKQQLRPETIPANRGSIYDRNMQILAQSAPVWDVVLSPKDITEENRLTIVQGLAQILGVDEDTVMEKSKKNNAYVVVKSKVEKDKADEVLAFTTKNKLSGQVYLTENTKRYYPNSTMAASVIGFAGTDRGLYGLEAKYNDVLSGTPGYTVSLKNATGENMPDSNEERFEPIDGNSLVLTIDETVQHFVEKTLNQVMAQHNPTQGCAAIVMNVNTGEILAMANRPTFDLNDPFTIYDGQLAATVAAAANDDDRKAALKTAQGIQWNNKAISYNYEPGSTFKLVTASAALEEGTSSLSSTFHCGGSIQVGDRTMKCHIFPRSHGTIDFTHAVVNSCNPAFVQIGAKLGGDLFFKYFESFGLTEKTGIDLPGEGTSLFYNAQQLHNEVSLASCSFGQSNSITPIQLITAVSAVVNGGNLVSPHVVKDILDENGNLVKSVGTQVKRQVISQETSEKMRTVMETVVLEKQTTNAYVAGYRVGGKSGTAQKLNKGSGIYVASYVAVAPIDDPQIAVLCMIDEPTSGQIYGSVVAMPPVASILADTLPYLGIMPQYTAEELAKQEVTMPLLTNSGVLEAESKLAAAGLGKPEIVGDGKTVIKQVPSVGSPIPKNGKVILYTDGSAEKTVTMPKVTSMRPNDARQLLENLGLNVIITGAAENNARSEITLQSYEEGASVPVGTVVELTSVEIYTD